MSAHHADSGMTELDMHLVALHWRHPVLGEIVETACHKHGREVIEALQVLGIGSLRVEEPEITSCLRCQSHPAMPPRVLLRRATGQAGREDDKQA